MYRSYTVLSKILRCFQQECQKAADHKLIWQQVNVIEKQILFIRLYGHEKLYLHREKLSPKNFMFNDLFGKYWPWHKWNVGCHWQHLGKPTQTKVTTNIHQQSTHHQYYSLKLTTPGLLRMITYLSTLNLFNNMLNYC